MRIRQSSGQASSGKVGGAAKAKGARGAAGAAFAQRIGRADAPESVEQIVRNVRSALLEELMGVAKDLADGKDSKDNTTKRFVSAVIGDRFKNLKGKNAKDVEERVSELINNDEAFAQRLHTQLSRLAKA